MQTDGYHLYRVEFQYKQETYTGEFLSTIKITPETNSLIAWGIADDCIKRILSTIPNRVKGVYPYDIYVKGEYGTLKVD